ncbi:MAG: hypothetical protein IPJ71_17685 [Bdellovibrionales bacterium]|nr:hypothetical protein [Bdellovibrionales bacterium]
MTIATVSAMMTLFLFVSNFILPASAQNNQPELDKIEFDLKLRDLNERFKDFYIHRENRKRQLSELLDSADEYRQNRLVEEGKYEEFRREYKILQGKRAPPEDFEPEYLKMQKDKERMEDVARQAYVKRRKSLEKFENQPILFQKMKTWGFLILLRTCVRYFFEI